MKYLTPTNARFFSSKEDLNNNPQIIMFVTTCKEKTLRMT